MQIYVSNKNALHSDDRGLKTRPKRSTFAAELYVHYFDRKFIILVKAVTESELSYAIERGIYKLPVTDTAYFDALDNASISAENAVSVIVFYCISALFPIEKSKKIPSRLTAAVNKIPSIYGIRNPWNFG